MKKLLATTAIVTALIATPALADKYVLDANGDFYDREMVHYAHGPIDNQRLVILGSDTQLSTYGDSTTVIRLSEMSEDDFRTEIGDLNRDGVINDYDVSIYVGDDNGDGVINYKDYQSRFGEDTVIIEQYSSLDGSTTVATTTIEEDFVPQNEGSTAETRDPYGETGEVAAHQPIEMGDDFVPQNEGSSMETRDLDTYGSVEMDSEAGYTTDSELSLWDRFKANFK